MSLLSAASVFNAIDKSKYEVVPIGITKEGRWLTAGDAERLLQGKARTNRSICGPAILRRHRVPRCWPAAKLSSSRPSPCIAGQLPWLRFRPMPRAHAARLGPGHQRRRDFPRAARNFRRRRNHPGTTRTRRHPLRGSRRSRFGRGHGQGHHEGVVSVRWLADRETCHDPTQRLGGRSKEIRADGRQAAEISGVCEARQPRVVGRNFEGAQQEGVGTRDRRGGQVRPQDRDRTGRRGRQAQSARD